MIIGEVRLFAGDIPDGWLACEGQALSVDDYPGLFQAIKVTYGGNGSVFNLPDLRGRTLIGASPAYELGVSGGTVTVGLMEAQMPNHTHQVSGTAGTGTQATPVGGAWAASTVVEGYAAASNGDQMAAAAVSIAGSGEGHSNMQPYLALRWAIAGGWMGT